MIGIYKITNPLGSVYIGQSIDVKVRMRGYRNGHGVKGQQRLKNSINKYGWENHKVEIVQQFPNDIERIIVDEYEIFYISQLKEGGMSMLNIKGGGKNGSHDEGTKRIISQKGKGKIISEEAKEKMRISALRRGRNIPIGYKHSKETLNKISKANIGRVSANKGNKYSEAVRLRMRNHKLGKVGGLCPNSKKIVCSITGRVYASIGEAAIEYGIKRTLLNSYLVGQNPNKTSLTYFNG